VTRQAIFHLIIINTYKTKASLDHKLQPASPHDTVLTKQMQVGPLQLLAVKHCKENITGYKGPQQAFVCGNLAILKGTLNKPNNIISVLQSCSK